MMGVEYYVCCDNCKVYYHLGKNLCDTVPYAMWEFVSAHRQHRIWTDIDLADVPVFCLDEYSEVKTYDDIEDSKIDKPEPPPCPCDGCADDPGGDGCTRILAGDLLMLLDGKSPTCYRKPPCSTCGGIKNERLASENGNVTLTMSGPCPECGSE